MSTIDANHIVDTFTTTVPIAVPVTLERIRSYGVQADITVLSAVSNASAYISISITGETGTYKPLAGSTQLFSGSETLIWNVDRVNYSYILVVYSLSAGEIQVTQTVDRRDY